MRRLICAAAFIGLLSGCGEAKIDASSPEAFKSSAEKISAGLPKDERAKFESDIMVIALKNFDMSKIFSGGKSVDAMTSDALKDLDGKTVGQVSEYAAKLKSEKEAQERKKAAEEIALLLDKQAKWESGKVQLLKFEVQSVKYYEDPNALFGKQLYIEMKVRNETGSAISAATFKGTLATPGRSVPWLSKSFSHSVPGGIEHGEVQTWKIVPSRFDGWGLIAVPDDAVLTVKVESVDGADGKALFGTGDFSEREKDRLASLKAKYQN